MRERDTQDLQSLVADEATIEHNRDFAIVPGGQNLLDKWCVQRTRVQEAGGKPASHFGDARDRLCITRNVVGNTGELNRACLIEANNDPDPIGQTLEVHGGVCVAKLVEHGGV